MSTPLKGIRVLELASYAMVPYASAILGDWGAEIIKIEHPVQGDAMRKTTAWNIPPVEGCSSYLFATANRGKRSIGLDITRPEGRHVFEELLRRADVFLTNFLPDVRARLRIEPEHLWPINPRLVIGRGTGYGPRGEEAGKGGFDGAVYWSRSGMAQATTPPGMHPLRMSGPGVGDSQCATGLAAGVLAALVQRERTGEADVVDTSLLAGGMWAMQASYAALASAGLDRFSYPERLERADNPLTFPYRTSDDRFVHISMLDSDKYWPGLCGALGLPYMQNDPRFAGKAQRSRNRGELVGLLDRVFGEKPLAHWIEALSTQAGPWSVVKLPGELRNDPQVLANDYIQDAPWDQGRTIPMVPAPAQFGMRSPTLQGAPRLGEHTEQVLRELGLGEADMAALKSDAAIA